MKKSIMKIIIKQKKLLFISFITFVFALLMKILIPFLIVKIIVLILNIEVIGLIKTLLILFVLLVLKEMFCFIEETNDIKFVKNIFINLKDKYLKEIINNNQQIKPTCLDEFRNKTEDIVWSFIKIKQYVLDIIVVFLMLIIIFYFNYKICFLIIILSIFYFFVNKKRNIIWKNKMIELKDLKIKSMMESKKDIKNKDNIINESFIKTIKNEEIKGINNECRIRNKANFYYLLFVIIKLVIYLLIILVGFYLVIVNELSSFNLLIVFIYFSKILDYGNSIYLVRDNFKELNDYLLLFIK